ncbi:MAG: imidazoleglycerol-phosphate dehydratase HisB [Clostridia bacterium]|nr:imidazoleglycerol-phosphate dehydratase HisB [Clostridia bacterium]
MRTACVNRKTNETDITLTLNLDGTGSYDICTGVGFFDHMLEQFARHGGYDISLKCNGDLKVDCHHTVEDCGIALGTAFTKALGDKRGIVRYGWAALPMDEALVLCAADLSGRDYLNFDVSFPDEYKLGDMDTELFNEFFLAFVRSCPMALHFKKLYGTNNHHVAECVFKAFAKAMSQATSINGKNSGALPTTKGTL